MKPILKILLSLGLGVLGCSVLLPSYLTTAVDGLVAQVRGQVPIEFEIKRAAGLVAKVEPQIETCKLEVAQAEVNLENLEREVDALTEKLAGAQAKLKHGAELLGGASAATVPATAVTAGLLAPPAARERIALNVKRNLEALKNDRDLLRSKAQLRDRQRAAVDSARARLEAVRAEKVRLEDVIASLRVQKAQVDALAATSPNVKLDDSALGEAKRVLAEIRKDLDVRQKMLEQDMVFAVDPAESPVAADAVLAEVNDFFAGNAAPLR